MKTKFPCFFVILSLFAGAFCAAAQGTAFTYQGQLVLNGSPANGSYDMTFTLYATNSGGTSVAGPVTNVAGVTNGLFTTSVDFGPSVFTGNSNWLEIAVRTNGSGTFATLAPRQEVSPTPNAIYSETGGTAMYLSTGVSVGQGQADAVGTGAVDSYVGGGASNSISPGVTYATVGGGSGNVASGAGAVIGGGGTDGGNFGGNTASGPASVIGGGIGNNNSGYTSTIGGGGGNTIVGGYATIGGGNGNNIANAAAGAVIGGGGTDGSTFQGNSVQGAVGVVGGGLNNHIYGYAGVVSGGSGNGNSGAFATVGGGVANDNSGNESSIGGGFNNQIDPSATGAVVGGGGADGTTFYGNYADGPINVIGGGLANYSSAYASFLGGGASNIAAGNYSVTVGGTDNTNYGDGAFIGGGGTDGGNFPGNYSTGAASVITGGLNNNNSGYAATIGGGSGNNVSGDFATIPGGAANVAGGDYSFAAGQQAQANNTGAFVWADSQNAAFASTQDDTFNARAQNGVFFADGHGNTMTWTPGAGGWNYTSDRNLKDRFATVDDRVVLDKVAKLPVAEWSYKGHTQRHIGAMAQDFHALFPLNDNDKALNDVDLHGVELSAIKGLNEKLDEKDAEIQDLKKTVADLQKMVQSLAEKK